LTAWVQAKDDPELSVYRMRLRLGLDSIKTRYLPSPEAVIPAGAGMPRPHEDPRDAARQSAWRPQAGALSSWRDQGPGDDVARGALGRRDQERPGGGGTRAFPDADAMLRVYFATGWHDPVTQQLRDLLEPRSR
jgi:hypothetical protein